MLGCKKGEGEDDVHHYAKCPIFRQRRHECLDLPHSQLVPGNLFLASPSYMSDGSLLAVGLATASLYKLHNHLRYATLPLAQRKLFWFRTLFELLRGHPTGMDRLQKTGHLPRLNKGRPPPSSSSPSTSEEDDPTSLA